MDDKLVLALLDKFNAGPVAELDYSDGSSRLLLRKDGATPRAERTQEPPAQIPLPANGDKEELKQGGERITSPIVATFYAAASPDAPPLVCVGSQVKAGDTLCILEAMKMMNHLEAEFDCEIVSIEARSGDMVEFGQTLFEVKRL
jgi:acetyl-CoA carboxylase biotin carboxyl carrier protein